MSLPPTPSQTVGPFYGYALPFPGGADIAPAGHPDAVMVHGYVTDGHGDPVPDALLEIWQGGGLAGSLRRDPVTGGSSAATVWTSPVSAGCRRTRTDTGPCGPCRPRTGHTCRCASSHAG